MIKPHFRTLFISDIHIFTRRCQAKKLMLLLEKFHFEHIIIVGDFLDILAAKKLFYFSLDQQQLVRKILKLITKKNIKLYWIIGNHDRPLCDNLVSSINDGDFNHPNIIILEEMIYGLMNGKTIFIHHGDIHDIIIKNWNWVAEIGDWLYGFLYWINKHVNKYYRSDFSISQLAKNKVKNIICPRFKKLCILEGKKYNVDFVMAGHVHYFDVDQTTNPKYLNTGDFCESNSGFMEDYDGNLYLIQIKDVDINVCKL